MYTYFFYSLLSSVSLFFFRLLFSCYGKIYCYFLFNLLFLVLWFHFCGVFFHLFASLIFIFILLSFSFVFPPNISSLFSFYSNSLHLFPLSFSLLDYSFLITIFFSFHVSVPFPFFSFLVLPLFLRLFVYVSLFYHMFLGLLASSRLLFPCFHVSCFSVFLLRRIQHQFPINYVSLLCVFFFIPCPSPSPLSSLRIPFPCLLSLHRKLSHYSHCYLSLFGLSLNPFVSLSLIISHLFRLLFYVLHPLFWLFHLISLIMFQLSSFLSCRIFSFLIDQNTFIHCFFVCVSLFSFLFSLFCSLVHIALACATTE